MSTFLHLSANDPLLAISIACTLLGHAMLVLGLRRLRPSAPECAPARIRNPLRRHAEAHGDQRRRRTDRQN